MNKQEKKALSERDICSKFITPAITNAGWDLEAQIREEVTFTKGKVIVRGKLHKRGKKKRALPTERPPWIIEETLGPEELMFTP